MHSTYCNQGMEKRTFDALLPWPRMCFLAKPSFATFPNSDEIPRPEILQAKPHSLGVPEARFNYQYCTSWWKGTEKPSLTSSEFLLLVRLVAGLCLALPIPLYAVQLYGRPNPAWWNSPANVTDQTGCLSPPRPSTTFCDTVETVYRVTAYRVKLDIG